VELRGEQHNANSPDNLALAERLQDLHASFSRHLRAEGKADRTIVIYGQSVRFFSQWLEAQGRTATLDS
jgi:hypothetical protein